MGCIESDAIAPLNAAGKVRTAQLAKAVLSKLMGAAAKDKTLGLYGNPCLGVEVGGKAGAAYTPLNDGERAAFREAVRGTEHEALWLPGGRLGGLYPAG